VVRRTAGKVTTDAGFQSLFSMRLFGIIIGNGDEALELDEA